MTRHDASDEAQNVANESVGNSYEQVEESFSEIDECPSVSTFTDDLPRVSTRVRVDGIIVTLHDRDSAGIVVVDYPAGACIADTAFSGGLEDAHTAVVDFARETGADVDFDEFDVLSEDLKEGKELMCDGGQPVESDEKHPTTTSRPLKPLTYDFGTLTVRVEHDFGSDRYDFHIVRPSETDVFRGSTDPLGEHDIIRGDDEFDGQVAVYVDSASNYANEGDISEVPAKVLSAVESEGFSVVTGIGAGWETWAGRPEFDGSETYIDLTDAEEYTLHRED